MANTNCSCHPFFPLTIDFYARALQHFPPPVVLTPKRNQPHAGLAEMNNIYDHEIDDSYDGRTHSVPYIKNGPYTCSKCKEQFVTSQRFAAHVVSAHYKYEGRDQRRKRLMKRVQGRNLTFQKVSDGLTFVPVSSKVAEQGGKGLASCVARVAYQGGEDPTMKVKVEGDLRSQYQYQAAPPGMEAHGVGLIGVKIKSEPYASSS